MNLNIRVCYAPLTVTTTETRPTELVGATAVRTYPPEQIMHIKIRSLGFLLLAAVACLDALADTGQDLATQTLPHVVTIRMFNAQAQETGLGSGFWLGGGEIVTNAHVVAGGAWAEIHSLDGQLIGTAPYAILLDAPSDLVVLTVPNGRMGGLGLAECDPGVGGSVWAFGAPLGLDGTVSSGIISATRETEGRRLLQMTVPISSGSSGGPVVDAAGNVVGIAAGMMREGQNLNFAIPVSALAALLRQTRGRYLFPAPETVGVALGQSEEAGTEDDGKQTEFAAILVGMAAADSVIDGNTYRGRLDESDIDVGGPTDFYRFMGHRGQRVIITVSSRTFDPMAEIMATHQWNSERADSWDASDDDSGGGTTARISAVLPSTGEYHIAVRSYQAGRGDYELSLGENRSTALVSGDRWIRVGGDDDMDVYWDSRTLSRSGQEATSWIRFVYKQAQSTTEGTQYDVYNGQWTFSCVSRRMKLLSVQMALGGENVSSTDIETWQQKWQNVVPETWAEALLEEACRGR